MKWNCTSGERTCTGVGSCKPHHCGFHVDENVQKVQHNADLIRSWLGTGLQRPVMKLHRVTSGQSGSPQDNQGHLGTIRVTSGQSGSPQDNQTLPQANSQSHHKTCANIQGTPKIRVPPPPFFPPSNRKTDKQ